ncbi:MAG: hypothetical protein ACJ75B_04630 [Flavisolibacter sp.]
MMKRTNFFLSKGNFSSQKFLFNQTGKHWKFIIRTIQVYPLSSTQLIPCPKEHQQIKFHHNNG